VKLSPEWKLLLACARTNISPEDLYHIVYELMDTGINWDHIVAISYQHGIAPLIYYNLQRASVDNALSQKTIDVLKSSYYGNSIRNMLLYQELKKILNALQERGVKVIVLKGAALAEIVYPKRALRPMSDIDLLVRKEDVSTVEDKLVEMGYLLKEHSKAKEWWTDSKFIGTSIAQAGRSPSISMVCGKERYRPS
jgi:hypothetical protein